MADLKIGNDCVTNSVLKEISNTKWHEIHYEAVDTF